MADDRCDLLCLDLPLAEVLRSTVPPIAEAEAAAARARGLADGNRVALATVLRSGGELCVCDLAWIVGRAENLVSHHLRLLRREGLVSSRRDGKMVLYSLTDAGSRGLAAILPASDGVPA